VKPVLEGDSLTRRIASVWRAARSVELGGTAGAWRELTTRVELAAATGGRHALRRVSLDVRHARGERRRQRAAVYDMWSAAAGTVGAALVDLGDGFLEIRKGAAHTRVHDQTVSLNDEVAILLASDKTRLYRMLGDSGIAVPEHRVFEADVPSRAVEFLESHEGPCVLKPARSAHGWGVTTQLRRPNEVRRAARWAGRFDHVLLIERQYEGAVHRLLVVDGAVVDGVRRHPPRVKGDGRSTIAELVEAEYEQRLRARDHGGAPSRFDPVTPPFVLDLDCLLTLRSQGLSPRSVPDAGDVVTVKTVTNQNSPADNETLATIPEDLADLAVAAAWATGLVLAGIDLVAPDGGSPVVIDVNAHPGLWHHYRVADPSRATDVAARILRVLLVDAGEGAAGQERQSSSPPESGV
jgi:cyanophycin synthetase